MGGWETAEARCVHAERARAEGEKRRGSAAAAGRAGRDEGEAEAGPPGELGLGSGAGDALLTAHSSALTRHRGGRWRIEEGQRGAGRWFAAASNILFAA